MSPSHSPSACTLRSRLLSYQFMAYECQMLKVGSEGIYGYYLYYQFMSYALTSPPAHLLELSRRPAVALLHSLLRAGVKVTPV